MSKYVTEIVTQDVVQEFCSNAGWSEAIVPFMTSIADPLYLYIAMNFDKLYAMDFSSYHASFLGAYLFQTVHLEIERVYQALIYPYKPYFNYYRSIVEENSGSDKHTYSGTDSEGTSGEDKYNGSYNETTNQKTLKPTQDMLYNSTYDDTNVATMKPTAKTTEDYDVQKAVGTNYKEATTYGKTTSTTFGKTLDMDFGRRVDTTIEGLNGLFSFQDLAKKEIILRMHYNLFDLIVQLIVKNVSLGVWDTE